MVAHLSVWLFGKVECFTLRQVANLKLVVDLCAGFVFRSEKALISYDTISLVVYWNDP